MEIVLCSPTVYAKFGGKHIVHALHGKDGRVQFQLGGGGLENLHRRCKFVGGGSAGFFGSEMVFSTFSMRYFSAKTQPG